MKMLWIFAATAAVALYGQPTSITKSVSDIRNNVAVSQNPNGSFKCVADGQPCTQEHLTWLSDLAGSSPSTHKGGESITCTTTAGKKCAPAEIAQLNSAMAMIKGTNTPIGGVSVPGMEKEKPAK